MNIIVIQFRTDVSGPHEVKCIHEAFGRPYSQFTFTNVFNDDFSYENLSRLSPNPLWILGGWGEAGYESIDDYWMKMLKKARQRIVPFIHNVRNAQQPLIGICFGFQVMTDALGGKLEVNPDMAEGGIYDISLTKEGKKDIIFAGMSAPFKAVLGHKTSVVELPRGAQNLAYSQRCPIQAAKFSENSYGFAFHPELTHQGLIERTKLYQDYVKNPDGVRYEEVHTDTILKNIARQFAKNDRNKESVSIFDKNSL